MAIAVGIDLGFRHTGLVSVEIAPGTLHGYNVIDCQACETSDAAKKRGVYVSQDNITQCQKLTSEVLAFIEQQKPRMLAVEAPAAGAKSAIAMRAMGIATGMIAAITYVTKLPVAWIIPVDSKKLLCGKKDASKDEMMDAVRVLYPCYPWPKTKKAFEHIADAVAALMVARSSDLYKLLSGDK